MAIRCGGQGASQSGVLAPPSCGVGKTTPRRSSLRLPLWLAPCSPRFDVHLGSPSWRDRCPDGPPSDRVGRGEPMFDKFHEECGVVGVYGHPEAATLAYLALYALQHRGQESAGIVSSDGEALISHRGMGHVAEIFDQEILSRLRGRLAIGHNRYSTHGSTVLKNCQPFV